MRSLNHRTKARGAQNPNTLKITGPLTNTCFPRGSGSDAPGVSSGDARTTPPRTGRSRSLPTKSPLPPPEGEGRPPCRPLLPLSANSRTPPYSRAQRARLHSTHGIPQSLGVNCFTLAKFGTVSGVSKVEASFTIVCLIRPADPDLLISRPLPAPII